MAADRKSKGAKAPKRTKRAAENPDLENLAAEFGADMTPPNEAPPHVEPEPQAEAPHAAPEFAGPGESFESTRMEFAGIVTGIGFMLCHRAGVTPMSADEVNLIADPLARLAEMYGFRIDGKVGAWFGLGGAVAAVYMVRLPEIEAKRAARSSEPQPGDDAPVAEGGKGGAPGFDGGPIGG